MVSMCSLKVTPTQSLINLSNSTPDEIGKRLIYNPHLNKLPKISKLLDWFRSQAWKQIAGAQMYQSIQIGFFIFSFTAHGYSYCTSTTCAVVLGMHEPLRICKCCQALRFTRFYFILPLISESSKGFWSEKGSTKELMVIITSVGVPPFQAAPLVRDLGLASMPKR